MRDMESPIETQSDSPILARLIDQLEELAAQVRDPDGTLLTDTRVQSVRQLLDVVRVERPQDSDAFEARIASIVQNAEARYRGRIEHRCQLLSQSSFSDREWKALVREGREWLDELAQLKKSEDDDMRAWRQSLDHADRHFRGMEILADAQRDDQLVREGILRKESEKTDLSLVPGEAAELSRKIAQYLEEAEAIKALPKVVSELNSLLTKSRELYESRRARYEEPLTADVLGEFENSGKQLEFVRSRDGDDATVLYPDSGDPNDKAAVPMPVSRAIQKCKERQQNMTRNRAATHLAKAKSLLRDGQPRQADVELKNITAVEELSQAQRDEHARLVASITGEITLLSRFEAAVKTAGGESDPFYGWVSLHEAQSEYKRTGSDTCSHDAENTPLWQPTRDELRGRLEGRTMRQLKEAVEAMYRGEMAEAAEKSQQIISDLGKWRNDFETVLSRAATLINLVGELSASLASAKTELMAKKVNTAAEALAATNASLGHAARSFPLDWRDRFVQQKEFRRLTDLLDVYQKQGDLLTRKHKELDETTKRAELGALVSEITSYVAVVEASYQQDFTNLLDYAKARYAFYMGKGILAEAGNPDEAMRYMNEATGHKSFKNAAQTEIADIQSRLLPAQERVHDAIAAIRAAIGYGDFWGAYLKAESVASEPVDKLLRNDLREMTDLVKQKAVAESRTILDRALDTARGDPKGLRIHAERMLKLEQSTLDQMTAALWPLINELEAEAAAAQKKWDVAANSYDEAARRLARGGMPAQEERMTKLRYRSTAATKQSLLAASSPDLPPDVYLEMLKPYRERQFSEDPDILCATVNATLEKVRLDEEQNEWQFEEENDAQAIDEVRQLQQERQRLFEARRQAQLTVSTAQRWRFANGRADYEQERANLLGVDGSELAAERASEAQKASVAVKNALTLNRKKLDLATLLRHSSGRDTYQHVSSGS